MMNPEGAVKTFSRFESDLGLRYLFTWGMAIVLFFFKVKHTEKYYQESDCIGVEILICVALQ